MLRVCGQLLEGVLKHLVIIQVRIEALRPQEREAVQVHELAVPDLLVVVSRVAAGVRRDQEDAADDRQLVGHHQTELVFPLGVIVGFVLALVRGGGVSGGLHLVPAAHDHEQRRQCDDSDRRALDAAPCFVIIHGFCPRAIRRLSS